MAEVCEYCSEIQHYKYVNNYAFKGWYPPKNRNGIYYDPNEKTFHIWSDGGGDSFRAGECMENIKYCPYCGRELKED